MSPTLLPPSLKSSVKAEALPKARRLGPILGIVLVCMLPSAMAARRQHHTNDNTEVKSISANSLRTERDIVRLERFLLSNSDSPIAVDARVRIITLVGEAIEEGRTANLPPSAPKTWEDFLQVYAFSDFAAYPCGSEEARRIESELHPVFFSAIDKLGVRDAYERFGRDYLERKTGSVCNGFVENLIQRSPKNWQTITFLARYLEAVPACGSRDKHIADAAHGLYEHQASSKKPIAGTTPQMVEAGKGVGSAQPAFLTDAPSPAPQRPAPRQREFASVVRTSLESKTPALLPQLTAVEIYKTCVTSVAVIENDFEVIGSAFVVSEDGFLFTNRHVIKGEDRLLARLGGKSYEVNVVYISKSTDCAVLKIDGDAFTPVPLGNVEQMEVGEQILVIGHPKGREYTISDGLYSNRVRSDGTFQISAPISPGNSGGPVFNLRGEAIGVATSVYNKNLDPNAENLNTALSIRHILPEILRSVGK